MILSPEACGCPLQGSGVSLVNSPICSGLALFMVLLEGFISGRCDIADPCSRVGVDEPEVSYDFIVVGSGPAGSIVAGRLSENPDFKVLLLEAGGDDPVGSRIPSFYRTFWSNSQVDWLYRTQPDNYCLEQGGKGCIWPRGKVLGGSSLLNGMMYHRGHAADYTEWVDAGAEGWSWEDVKPFLDLTEGNKQIGTLVDAEYHSASGPLPVQQFRYQPPFVFDLLRGVNESGLPIITDMNNPNTPEGFVIAQAFNDDGQRFTPARAYLKPKSQRPNLDVLLQAHVSRVLFNGTRAIGVEYIDKNGQTKTVLANKEVILSAGALNTPHILLLSGIGPRETLDKFNIPVIADLPVGQNLKNHYGFTLYFLITNLKLYQNLDWKVLTEYLLERNGEMSSTGITQLTGLLYSSLAQAGQPDIQFFFNGFYAECSRTGEIHEPVEGCDLCSRNISANAALLRPRSFGYLTLNSTDPLDPPLFYPGYFSHEDDLVMIRDGARYLQRIFESDTLKNTFGVTLDPAYESICVDLEQWSDEWIECQARVHTDPQNHQVGTAVIGRVIDTELRVYGVEGLRVIDASAIPTVPTGNPQGPIMAVAERGAYFIKNTWASKNVFKKFTKYFKHFA